MASHTLSHRHDSAYRADIDGLRALAVLPVLFFHAGVPGFSGGYVGVDVFFVISGYLITSILWRDIGLGHFSIAKFYERRIRRLLPALFVVLLACVVIGAWLLLPMRFRDFGKSMIAVAGFASNILFYRDTGYFDAPAELKPLLHTWSLAVEEQFYLFFPLLLMWIHRNRSKWAFPLIIALAVMSFGANIAFVGQHQSAVFYLLPFRAWELLLGAILAMGIGPRLEGNLSVATCLLGIASIVAAVIGFDSSTLFPGWAALLPCLGAALIIYAGEGGRGASAPLLTSPILTFVGRISYSLYLWHWPLIVFAKQLHGTAEFDSSTSLGVIALSLLLASLSYRFVEQPFRNPGSGLSRRTMFAGATAASVIWLILGGIAYVTDGLPSRLSESVVRFAAAAEDFSPSPSVCGKGQIQLPANVCHIGVQDASPTFLMWGDSHAGIMVHGVEAAAHWHGAGGVFSGVGGCPPLIGIEKDENTSDAATDSRCAVHNAALLYFLETQPEIDTVLLVSRWAYYANGQGFGPESRNTVRLWAPASTVPAESQVNSKVFENGLRETLIRLTAMGKRVYLVEQVPELDGYSAERIAARLARQGEDALPELERTLSIDRKRVIDRQKHFAAALQPWREQGLIGILGTHEFFCTSEVCRALAGPTPLYFDNNHVTTSTSIALQHIYAPLFSSGSRGSMTGLRKP